MLIVISEKQWLNGHFRKHGQFQVNYSVSLLCLPVKGSNGASKFVHVLHPAAVACAAHRERIQSSGPLWNVLPVQCGLKRNKNVECATWTHNTGLKYLLYNISFQSNHSLNDLLSWVFRGPGMRAEYAISYVSVVGRKQKEILQPKRPYYRYYKFMNHESLTSGILRPQVRWSYYRRNSLEGKKSCWNVIKSKNEEW